MRENDLRPRAYIFAGIIILVAGWPSVRAADEREAINTQLAFGLVGIIRNERGTATTQARIQAAQALGQMGIDARHAIPSLIQILQNPSRGYPFSLDEAIVEAVGRLGTPARIAVPALVRNVGADRDLDRAISESVSVILSTPQAIASVAAAIEALKDLDPAERVRAAKILATLGLDARPAIPALTASLSDPDADVRRQALVALRAIQPGATPTQATLGVHIRDLTDIDASIRLRAAKALALIGPAARFSLPALQAAARSDPDDDVRRVAADAIFRIGGTTP